MEPPTDFLLFDRLIMLRSDLSASCSIQHISEFPTLWKISLYVYNTLSINHFPNTQIDLNNCYLNIILNIISSFDNMDVHIYFLKFPWEKYPEKEYLNHMTTQFSLRYNNTHTVFQSICTISLSVIRGEEYQTLGIIVNTWDILVVFECMHLKEYEVTP